MSKLQYLLQNKLNTDVQRAKKLASDSPGLVDFAIGLMNSVLNLPDGQVKIFEEFKLHKNCVINPAYQMETCKTDFLCTLDVALFTTYIKSVFQQIRLLSGLTVVGKMRSITFQLILLQCCKTSALFVA